MKEFMKKSLSKLKLLATSTALILLVGCQGITSPIAILPIHHPLDPLSVEEYSNASSILRTAGYTDDDSRFVELEIYDPSKQNVKQWQEGETFNRSAFAIVKQGFQTFEAVIDLSNSLVKSWQEIENVQPSMIIEDYLTLFATVAEDEMVIAALAARDLTPDEVFCSPMSIGNYSNPLHEGRRLLKAPCYVVAGEGSLFTRPIEGISAIVDLNTKEVIELIDTGIIPIPNNPAATTITTNRKALNKTVIHQPEGANFSVNGHVVKWDNWTLHYRMEKRSGLVISDVTYLDGDRERSILYQGAVSELFVPYMDPDLNWYSRTFLDAGEYGFGASATPLMPGADCPDTALFLDANIPDDFGAASAMPNVICIFERNLGDAAWRHFDLDTGYEGRPSLELVLRMGAAIGNYDYFIDWVFTQDGRIRPRIGASGYDGYKGVISQSMNDPSAAADTAFGTLVTPGLVGTNHDHFFSIRLDVDIDGADNSLTLDRLVPKDIAGSRTAWVVQSEVPTTEQEAMLNYNPARPTNWKVVNPNIEGPVGHSPGYVLKPMNSIAYTLLDASDPAHQRAAFTEHQLWTTPYKAHEHYAAGNYVNQGNFRMGLPAWTAEDRPIENTDIVLWYTAGFHHVPRAEDFPIMPSAWHEFELMPFNFFDRNPALDIPPETNDQ